MPEETIRISAERLAPQGQVLDKVVAQLNEELRERTGLTPAEVVSENKLYRVSLQLKGKGKETVTGESTQSVEDAIAKAAGERAYHDNTVSLTVEREVVAPYFTVHVNAVGVGKEACLADLTRQTEALQTRYNQRVQETPQSVGFNVLHTSYAKDSVPLAELVDPTKRDENRILGSGISNVRMEEAETAAGTKKGTISTVYMAQHELKIFGPEAYQAPAEEAVEAQPGVLGRAGRAVQRVAGRAAAAVGAAIPSARSAPRHAYAGGGGGASPTNAVDSTTDLM